MLIELALLLLWLVPVVWVRSWVSKTLDRGFEIPARSAKTGAEIAGELLALNKGPTVSILRAIGPPLDFFDARRRELRFSKAVHDGGSLTSVALAAIETSQATRRDRGALVRAWTSPIADLIAGSGWIVLISGVFVWWPMLAHLGLDLLNAALLIGLLTLPAELIAARDARASLAKTEATTLDEEAILDAILLAGALRPVAAPLNLPLLPLEAMGKLLKRGSRTRRNS